MRNIVSLLTIMGVFSLAACSSAEKSFEDQQQNTSKNQQEKKVDEQAQHDAQNKPTKTVERVPAAKKGTEFPPSAKTGECYARVIVPPVTEWKEDTVVLREEYKKISTIPATFKDVEKEIVIKEASEKIVPVAAQYKLVEEKVLIKPEEKKLVRVPAQYKTVTEKVLVSPEREVWKKGDGPITKIDEETGDILCLVKEPAVYKTVKKNVLVSAETTREEIIPAQYQIIKKSVVASPATVQKTAIPEVKQKMIVREIASEAQIKETVIPAKVEKIKKQVILEPSKTDWKPVLCKTNMTKPVITRLQKALKAEGLDPGVIDGSYGGKTAVAVREYQKQKGLAVGGLTLETLSALNVKQ